MIEALWSAVFRTNENTIGGGVAIFETGRLFGGDSNFVYTGSYEIDRGKLRATVNVSPYSEDATLRSAFAGAFVFTLIVEGDYNDTHMVLSGHMKERPASIIEIDLVRRAELP